MEIKEAVEIFRTQARKPLSEIICADLKKYNLAVNTLISAFDSGYILCKVDEALEKMEGKKFLDLAKTDIHCGYDGGLSTAIEILKEACK